MKPLTPDQSAFVAQHLGLARKFVGDFIRRDKRLAAYKDDLIQTATLGLMRAAQTYDPSRCKFSVYAWPWMLAAMQKDGGRDFTAPVRIPWSGSARKAKAPRGSMPLRRSHSPDPTARIFLAQLIDEMRREQRSRNTEEGRRFRERNLEMLAYYVRDGETLEQIGQRYGVSREYVRLVLADLKDIAEAA